MPAYVRQAVIRVVLWVLLSGSAVGFYAFWTRDTTRLTSNVVSDTPDVAPERMWATGDQTFIGYSARSGYVNIWTVTASEQQAIIARRNVDATDGDSKSVAVSRDGSHVFWLAADKLVCYDLTRQSRQSVAIPALEPNSLLQASDNAVVAVSPSGAIRIYRAASLTPIVSGTIPVRNADLTETHGSFVAIAERATGSVVVVDTRISSRIGLTESRSLGTRIAAIAITGAGTLAIATESGSIFAAEQLGAPGFVRSLQHYDDKSFLVMGNFGGVHLVPVGAETQEVSAAEPGALALATTARYFLLSYPGGLQLHAMRFVSVVRPKAINLFRVWLGATLVFVCFSFFRVLGRIFRMLRDLLVKGWGAPRGTRNKPPTQKHVPEIGEPPADLLAAAADRSCAIFAGEELSRASGMPTWRIFVLGLIDRLYDALLLEAEHADASRKAHRAGECDRVARQLAPVALAHREILNEFARSMYCKPAALTQVHEALGAVNASALITPNLDSLAERCFRFAPAEAFTPAESGDAVGRLLRKDFVVMKLRGVFERPTTLRVWPAEAQAFNAKEANLRRFLGAILTHRCSIFIGAGVGEIEAWLDAADLPATPSRQHYALVAKNDGYNVKQAHALHARFNIQCITYPPEDTAAVIEFLAKLSATVAVSAATSP